MTLHVDPRVGSKHLIAPLRRSGHKVSASPLKYGDIMFRGNGPKGPLLVGIELKKLPDLISSLISKRLVGHQIPGLVRAYQYRWLVVEGVYRPASDGSIEYYDERWRRWCPLRSSITYHALTLFLITVAQRAGLRLYVSSGQRDTVGFICSLYRWWTSKRWHEHHAHLDYDRSHQEGKSENSDDEIDKALFFRPRLVHRVAKELPGVARVRTGMVVRKFKSVRRMVNATERAWCMVPGIGPKTARRIVRQLEEEV